MYFLIGWSWIKLFSVLGDELVDCKRMKGYQLRRNVRYIFIIYYSTRKLLFRIFFTIDLLLFIVVSELIKKTETPFQKELEQVLYKDL